MIRSLIAIISLGFMALLNFYLYSYNSPLRGSLTTGQNLILTKEKVLIFGATTFFGKPLWSKDIISETCSQEIEEYCHFTTNPNRSKEADAWLYHNRDFLPQMMESRGDAVHVILCHESPTYETILYTANTINWTMTYKRGSDIVIPYGTFAKNDSIEDLDFIWNMKSPNVTASWMASHCNTANRREQLILKARNSGLQLDVYGKCHNGSQIPECPKDSKDWETCAGAVLQKYFFYFSFENSNCVDYVTEKLYNSWAFYFTVPIVIKREIYTKIGFPPKSFVALDDFASIQDLVYFLNYLKTNRREYLRYHEWRKEYEVKRIRMESGLCTLCQRLKYPTLQTKSYPDLKSWFSQEADCDNSYADKYL